MISKKSFEKKLAKSLIRSASFTLVLYKHTCGFGYVDRENCAWYHGLWQYLRLCDKASAPTWHFDFYVEELSRILEGNDSILISSSADYSTLAIVVEVLKKLQLEASITVVDICKTPLILNQWYAEEVIYPINILHRDIRKLNLTGVYDLIITDAFLTRFNNIEKDIVVEQWNRALKPNGYIITTVRVEKDLHKEWVTPEKEYIGPFIDDLKKCLNVRYGLNIKKIKVIEQLARTYGNKMISYPFKSKNDVINLFKNNNFTVEKSNTGNVKGEFRPTTYCRIVARKTEGESINHGDGG